MFGGLALLFLLTTLQNGARAFTCTQSDAFCGALGDLYAATGGGDWMRSDGWEDAAAGVATSYCAMGGVVCTPGVGVTILCALLRRAAATSVR